MRRVDSRFERLARKLTSLELRRPEPAAVEGGVDGLLDGLLDGGEGRREGAFVDAYSVAGLRTVIEHYGLHEKLVAKGIGDYGLIVTEEDPFHHRLQMVLKDEALSLDDRRIMDMRLHLARLSMPGAAERADPEEARADVVAVEWLRMQNPRARFTRERPRLPGQTHPGTGLGGDVAQLLVLMCRRIGREGLVTVPERFHLAELYGRGGWIAPGRVSDRLIDEVKLAAPGLSFAARAWAMERGCVFDEDGAAVSYVPEERVLPVSDRLAAAFAPGGSWLLALLEPRRRLTVDVERLRASLRADPVDGMDAEALDS